MTSEQNATGWWRTATGALLADTAIRSFLLAGAVVLTMVVGWWGTLWYPGQMILYGALLGCAGGAASVPEGLLERRPSSWRTGLAAGALTALVAPVLLAISFL